MISRIILGFIFFLFAFAVSLFTIYLCFKVVMRITKYDDISLINKNNIAASLVIVSSFIATAIMVKNAIYPISAVVQDFWLMAEKNILQFVILLGRAIAYFLVTVVLSLASIGTALFVFQKMTKSLNEEQEIQKNNIAIGLLLGGVLIAFALLVETGISDFVNTLIPLKKLF
ncbi:MAG: DUF350 domain-containing protein [Candidatus Aminicenantes bacterium]|nr:DUF350 domain-containing protein [Candidatus Aminicenantes bacterium]